MLHIDYKMFNVMGENNVTMIGNVLPGNLGDDVEELVGTINGDSTGKSICHKDNITVKLFHITGKTADYYEIIFFKNGNAVPCITVMESTISGIKSELRNIIAIFKGLTIS